MNEYDTTLPADPGAGSAFSRRSAITLAAALGLTGVASVVPAAAQSRNTTANDIARGGGSLVVALWEAKAGQEDAVTAILRRFLPQAQSDPGVKLFLIGRGKDHSGQFVFYELFIDDDAIAAHRSSEYFKTMIVGEALPLLSKRESTQYSLL
jgi:quinol monooxygenase YgiN